VVAAAGSDCVVIASRDFAMSTSPRAYPSTVIWKIDDHVAVAATGYVVDNMMQHLCSITVICLMDYAYISLTQAMLAAAASIHDCSVGSCVTKHTNQTCFISTGFMCLHPINACLSMSGTGLKYVFLTCLLLHCCVFL
jgi:hypothetical protein